LVIINLAQPMSKINWAKKRNLSMSAGSPNE
jgi:hypothetical protein